MIWGDNVTCFVSTWRAAQGCAFIAADRGAFLYRCGIKRALLFFCCPKFPTKTKQGFRFCARTYLDRLGTNRTTVENEVHVIHVRVRSVRLVVWFGCVWPDPDGTTSYDPPAL